MDSDSEQTLARIISETHIASLGTLHEGETNLAMVAYIYARDFSAFYIHVSKLGKHTRDMESDPGVSLLIAETDDQHADPQTLARQNCCRAMRLITYTSRTDICNVSPEAEPRFSLGDFNLWKITPKSGRFVAGFGRAFNLVSEGLKKAASL